MLNFAGHAVNRDTSTRQPVAYWIQYRQTHRCSIGIKHDKVVSNHPWLAGYVVEEGKWTDCTFGIK